MNMILNEPIEYPGSPLRRITFDGRTVTLFREDYTDPDCDSFTVRFEDASEYSKGQEPPKIKLRSRTHPAG